MNPNGVKDLIARIEANGGTLTLFRIRGTTEQRYEAEPVEPFPYATWMLYDLIAARTRGEIQIENIGLPLSDGMLGDRVLIRSVSAFEMVRPSDPLRFVKEAMARVRDCWNSFTIEAPTAICCIAAFICAVLLVIIGRDRVRKTEHPPGSTSSAKVFGVPMKAAGVGARPAEPWTNLTVPGMYSTSSTVHGRSTKELEGFLDGPTRVIRRADGSWEISRIRNPHGIRIHVTTDEGIELLNWGGERSEDGYGGSVIQLGNNQGKGRSAAACAQEAYRDLPWSFVPPERIAWP